MFRSKFAVILVVASFSSGICAGAQEIAPAPRIQERSCEFAAAAFRAREFERAASLARSCIEQGLANSETYKLLALSSYLLKRPNDFKENMEKVIALSPDDGDAYYHLGRFYFEEKRYSDALEHLRKSIALDPDNYRARYYSGLCRQGSADEQDAVEDFQKAIEIIEKKRVNYGWPFGAFGDLLILQGEVDRGLSWLYRGTRNDPTLPYVHFIYARALLRKEATMEVEQGLQRAIKLDPGYSEAYYVLGRYYSKIGDKERAQAAFTKFEELRKNPIPSPFGLRR